MTFIWAYRKRQVLSFLCVLSIERLQAESNPVAVLVKIFSVKGKETLKLFIDKNKTPICVISLKNRYALYNALQHIADIHAQTTLYKLSIVWKKAKSDRLSAVAALVSEAYEECRRPASPAVTKLIECVEMGNISCSMHIQARATGSLNGAPALSHDTQAMRVYLGRFPVPFAEEQPRSLTSPPVYIERDYTSRIFSIKQTETIAVGAVRTTKDLRQLMAFLQTDRNVPQIQLLIRGSIGDMLLAYDAGDALQKEQIIRELIKYFKEKRGNLVSLRVLAQ
jgi:hypothetical protein